MNRLKLASPEVARPKAEGWCARILIQDEKKGISGTESLPVFECKAPPPSASFACPTNTKRLLLRTYKKKSQIGFIPHFSSKQQKGDKASDTSHIWERNTLYQVWSAEAICQVTYAAVSLLNLLMSHTHTFLTPGEEREGKHIKRNNQLIIVF